MKKSKSIGGKGFYILMAAILLAVGGVTRLSLDAGTTKTDTPKKPDTSSITSSQSPKSTLPSTPSKVDTGSSENQVTSSKSEKTVAPKKQSEQAATDKIVTFSMPIKANIIKAYDEKIPQYSKTFGDMRLHSGIDIVSAAGTPVAAAGDGTVGMTGENAIWGKFVEIDHQNGIISRYCGLDEIKVKKGAKIEMGKIVGTVGSVPCECLDETHLHFEMLKDNSYISPMQAMGLE